MRSSYLLIVVLALGCVREPRSTVGVLSGTAGTASATGVTTADSTGDDGSAASSGSDVDTDDGSGDPDPDTLLLDVAPGAGTGPGDEQSGCQKVDFLFVVDNSASMIQNQQALVAAFPGFIAAIQAEVAAQDYHILVADSDEDPTIACEGAYPQVACGDPYVCGDYPCGSYTLLDGCDQTLGAGVVAPRGGHTANGQCGVPAGQRHITSAQPLLAETFGCMATTGTSGNWDERPFEAVTVAVSDGMNGPGACNAGFLRDDAILVVTVLTTGDPGTSTEASQGNAQAWYEALVAAKGGDETAIVFLAITTPHACLPIGFCSGSQPYASLVGMFGERGRVYPIDSDDYVPYFQEAVALIDTTCDEFNPEG